MNADLEIQLRLLDLQGVDSTIDRLAQRRRTLPELARLEELARELSTVHDEVVTAETEDRDLAREQTRLEGDVDLVRGRMDRDQQRLDTGSVASPRELEQLQSEIASLHRRQADLEEQVLEVMQNREDAQRRLHDAATRLQALRAEEAATAARRDEALAHIEAESQEAGRRREELAAGIPAELLALYDRVRASAGGVGAAALHRGRCEGCHLQLTTVDVNRIRAAPADEVLRCEECRRVLVRTPESGL